MRHNNRLVVRLIVLMLMFSALHPIFESLPAHADGSITISEHSTESNFRRTFIFHVKASAATGKIVSARLYWHIRAVDNSTVTQLPKFAPTAEVSLDYTLDTRTMTTPPWQVVIYRWELLDDAGNTFTSPDYEGEFSDTTRQWQKLSDGKVTVYWYDHDQDYGQELFSVAEQGYQHVVKATGYTPTGDLRIVLYNGQDDFCSFYAPGDCLNWIGGQTYNSLTVQWLKPNDDFDKEYVFMQTIPHELAHAFLRYWMGPRVSTIPIWFDEGQAVNNQIEGIDEAIARARDIARGGRLERLAFINARGTITRNQHAVVTEWYAQATSLVAFLYDRFGTDILGKIITRINNGMGFEKAFTDATGLTMDEFELAWRDWLGATGVMATIAPTMTFPPFPPTPTYPPKKSQ